jgi:lipopolysaccharide transport system ATP-binding protein
MSDRDVVIRVEGISKLYRLGEVGTGSLAHDVNRWWHRVRGKEDPYLKIGEVNDRTKSVSSVQRPESSAKKTKRNLTTEDTENTEVGAGLRLGSQAGAEFPNPSTSELARDSENTSLIRSANAPRSSEEKSDPKSLDSRPSSLDSPKAPPSDWVYALKDVSFEVKRGEVLGIIGRNGAGKSTLLKILSRVTTQSSGQIKVKGRIASLLEVGTGFHPELTGRENIFLNGAILGMRKAEIARKFDEIVEFSGCARYIDTPVKRYSSGMYVRLAFAVAAHLEPEILIVDEVLAVGDLAFQSKCIDKMSVVSGEGRTILFVSHNMGAVKRLCPRSILLNQGGVEFDGPTNEVIDRYVSTISTHRSTWVREETSDEPAFLSRVWASTADGQITSDFQFTQQIRVHIEFQVKTSIPHSTVWIGVRTVEDVIAFGTADTDMDKALLENRPAGSYHAEIRLPECWLNAGRYYLVVGIAQHNPTRSLDRAEAIDITIHDVGTPEKSSTGQNRPGILQPFIPWSVTEMPAL